MNKDRSKKKKQGQSFSLRQNQLFGPWGVGAILPCPDGSSIMIAGLDAFPVNYMDAVHDRRLSRFLGVSKFYAPPIEDACVPALRFPKWMYCPICGMMKQVRGTDDEQPHCTNPDCKGKAIKLVPERFIVVCPEGHVDDFPIMNWVHRGPVDDHEKHVITRITTGGSAVLADIVYRCSCGKSRSLNGSTKKGALSRCGIRCRGSRPWLNEDYGSCSAEEDSLRVVQRGGTNVWYADVTSSIYVPDQIPRALAEYIDENWVDLLEAHEVGALDRDIKFHERLSGFSKEEIKNAFSDRLHEEIPQDETEGDYREAEYKTLKAMPRSSQKKGSFEGVVIDSSLYDSELIESVLESVTLVSTLEETKALVGFSRLLPDANEGKKAWERRRILSKKVLDWTLGLQTKGEGIFLAFDKPSIDAWISSSQVKKRFSALQKNFDDFSKGRGGSEITLNPAYVLIHTLSHTLMLGLSKACGYSTASIKERIYCDKYLDEDDRHESMLGLLIYTASSDSEGSLGGLVRAGKPGRFEEIFNDALEMASWCSSDPVCIESPGQGPGSCNLAACYSCALVPETSCETGNRLLDRALLVGTLADESIGFFKYVLKHDPNGNGAVLKLHIQDAGVDISMLSFSEAYDRAAAQGASDDWKPLIRELSAKAEGLFVEIPRVNVEMADDDDNSASAPLVWVDSQVILLDADDLKYFEEAFGRLDQISGDWRIFSAGDVTAEQLLSELKRDQ